MKNQVTRIEQSKRLIELGVPAERASMVWEYWINQDFSKDVPEEVFYNLNTKTNRGTDSCDRDIPAFTVADLLGMIPKTITNGSGSVCKLNVEICSSTNHCWCLFWGDDERQIGWKEHISFMHLLEDAIEWVLAAGYKLNQ